MLTFVAFMIGGTVGAFAMAAFAAGSRADETQSRIPRKQEQEAVAGEFGAAELSVRHSVGDAA